MITPRTAIPAGPRRGGFTLVEVMIGGALGSIVLLGVLTTYIALAKTGFRIQNYTHMENATHGTLEDFAQDSRMCQSSAVILNSATSITFTVPGYYTANSNLVTYYFDSTRQVFCRRPGGGATGAAGATENILMDHVVSCRITGYDLLAPPNTHSTNDASPLANSGIRRIELTLTSQMNTANNSSATSTANVARASVYVVSATYLLRN